MAGHRSVTILLTATPSEVLLTRTVNQCTRKHLCHPHHEAQDAPPEVLLNILDHLEGDSKTLLSLIQTCKLFGALLTEMSLASPSELRSTKAPAHQILARGNGTNDQAAIFSLAYQYLHSGTRHAIPCQCSGERRCLQRSIRVWHSVFGLWAATGAGRPRGCPTLRSNNPACGRALFSECRTAHELVWANLGHRGTAGLALRSHDLIRFVVKTLYLIIENHHAYSWGPSDAPSGFFPDQQQADRLTNYLLSGMLLSGAKGIVDILSTTYECYDQFVAVARQRLYNVRLERHMEGGLWPQQQFPRRLWFISALRDGNTEERFNGSAYKEYVGDNDIDGWKSDIIGDAAWKCFMHANGWSKPLLFTPAQLRMKLPKPICQPTFATNGGRVWDATDWKPIMAQPIAA